MSAAEDLRAQATGQLLLRDVFTPSGPVRRVMVLGLLAVPAQGDYGDDLLWDLSGTRNRRATGYELLLTLTPREPAALTLARRSNDPGAALTPPVLPRSGVAGEALLRRTSARAPDGRHVMLVAGTLWTARRSALGGDMMHAAFGGDRMGALVVALQPLQVLEERYRGYRADQLVTSPIWRV